MKNVEMAMDRINLPAFSNTVPAAKLNWGYDPKRTKKEVLDVVDRLDVMKKTCHLVAMDLLSIFISRRVISLQSRPHKVGHMSDRHDPSRTSAVELSTAEVVRQINLLTKAKLKGDWSFGMRPFDRSQKPPLVSLQLSVEKVLMLSLHVF